MAGIAHHAKAVFGLDIGTRSIVGTVGYKDKDRFVVIAQRMQEHETRAMMDGQIHDIKKVGDTITAVKESLEQDIGAPLTEVCIAAAGRVLLTVTTHVDLNFFDDKIVTEEDIYALSAMGVEQAYEEFISENKSDMKFYCVGYSVVRYYMNQYPIGNPIDHKARIIGVDMIVTFLPEDVVDGLYRAVEYAGLKVANMTLEPIAAIQVAIPEKFRMLNIALVDVGAGTSDISITKDGTIISYGMIPIAGDSLTETIANHCLVDFNSAEQIKRHIIDGEVMYTDIMGLTHTISEDELMQVLAPAIDGMTQPVADCIRQLNGDKSVSAVFVVGGGGKIPGYTESLSAKLDIAQERTAVRGSEVMGFVDFPKEIEKDSMLVTPVGICLSFYEHNNNFVFVTFNEERIKIYDNGKLTLVDAAIQAEFPNDRLFPKRGKELNYTVEGKARIKRGELGEVAIITVNGEPADINTPIKANDVISVIPSTAGAAAEQEVRELPEFNQSITVSVNNKNIILPKFAQVNGVLQSGYYEIQEGDSIVMQNYYSVGQILEFMDILLPEDAEFMVNNAWADRTTPVYENFSVAFGETVNNARLAEAEEEEDSESHEAENREKENLRREKFQEIEEDFKETEDKDTIKPVVHDILVIVNGIPIKLSGKASYVYVDVFDYIDFDLSKPKGSGIFTGLNGQPAEYLKEIKDGDVIDIYWRS